MEISQLPVELFQEPPRSTGWAFPHHLTLAALTTEAGRANADWREMVRDGDGGGSAKTVARRWRTDRKWWSMRQVTRGR